MRRLRLYSSGNPLAIKAVRKVFLQSNELTFEGHCNFYTVPIMFSLAFIEPFVSPSWISRWRSKLGAVVPARSYRGWPHIAGNWAIVALVGEALRFQAGLRNSTADIESQLGAQFTDFYWTDNGEYQDHSGCGGKCSPIPYGV